MADQRLLSYITVGQGKPVLFLHGLGGSGQQWQDVVPADWQIRQLLPDLPGHGQTGWLPVEGCTFETFADVIVNTFAQFGPMPVAGISMGAGIALRLALQVPDWVEKLLLIRPAWLDQPQPPNLDILSRLGSYWRDHSVRQTQNWLLNDSAFLQLQRESPACAESVVGQLRRPHPALAARTLYEMTDSAPITTRTEMQVVHVPTVVVGSANDPLHPLSLAEMWANWLPNAQFHEVPSRYEQPAEYLRQIQQQLGAFLSIS